jgi:hypothetical protein
MLSRKGGLFGVTCSGVVPVCSGSLWNMGQSNAVAGEMVTAESPNPRINKTRKTRAAFPSRRVIIPLSEKCSYEKILVSCWIFKINVDYVFLRKRV